MSKLVDTIGGVESTDWFIIQGTCDLFVSGLTSGSVKLQILFQGETVEKDWPEGEFADNVYKTLFISEEQAKVRVIGVSCNAGVYVRLGRGITR